MHFEEKETDVAISTKLIEVLHLDAADTVVLVTGDTDLGPAVRTARSLFPAKRIWFVFPYKRKNNELAQIADGYCYIRKERYAQHQFPAAVTLIPPYKPLISATPSPDDDAAAVQTDKSRPKPTGRQSVENSCRHA